MSVILATQKAAIRRIEIQSQTGQRVHETLSGKKKNHKNHKTGGGMAQGGGPEFTPQYKKKKRKRKRKQARQQGSIDLRKMKSLCKLGASANRPLSPFFVS
jgi:hypothetical protein